MDSFGVSNRDLEDPWKSGFRLGEKLSNVILHSVKISPERHSENDVSKCYL